MNSCYKPGVTSNMKKMKTIKIKLENLLNIKQRFKMSIACKTQAKNLIV